MNNGLRFMIETKAISTFVQLSARYEVNGVQKSFDPESSLKSGEEDLNEKMLRLRGMMYVLAPEKGAWYTAKIEIKPGGKFNIQYDYDNKPNFTYEPAAEKYKLDQKKFPRDKETLPDWLKSILNS